MILLRQYHRICMIILLTTTVCASGCSSGNAESIEFDGIVSGVLDSNENTYVVMAYAKNLKSSGISLVLIAMSADGISITTNKSGEVLVNGFGGIFPDNINEGGVYYTEGTKYHQLSDLIAEDFIDKFSASGNIAEFLRDDYCKPLWDIHEDEE